MKPNLACLVVFLFSPSHENEATQQLPTATPHRTPFSPPPSQSPLHAQSPVLPHSCTVGPLHAPPASKTPSAHPPSAFPSRLVLQTTTSSLWGHSKSLRCHPVGLGGVPQCPGPRCTQRRTPTSLPSLVLARQRGGPKHTLFLSFKFRVQKEGGGGGGKNRSKREETSSACKWGQRQQLCWADIEERILSRGAAWR